MHIKNSGTDDTFRWKRAIEQFNTLAPKQDAFVIVGDFTDTGSANNIIVSCKCIMKMQIKMQCE